MKQAAREIHHGSQNPGQTSAEVQTRASVAPQKFKKKQQPVFHLNVDGKQATVRLHLKPLQTG